MLKDTILTVQTCDLKVDINCDGCVKEIKKILNKIDGVYQTNVDRQQGKVTVTGLMDMDTVFKRLKKAGMSAQLWDTNSAVVSKHQKLQLGGSDKGDQLKDAVGKGLSQGEASGSGGGTNDATTTMVLPQLTAPIPQQHVPNVQQQIEQRLQMLKGENKLPPHLTGMPPAINRGGMQSGKKIVGGGTEVLVPGNANNYNNNGKSMMKNGVIGQPPQNSALGSLNNHNQAKKDISVGVGSQMMGPQNGGMMRPSNNMIGPTSFPIVGGMSMGPYTHLDGGGAIHGGLGMPASSLPGDGGFYPSSAGSSGMEMMQARNPMPQQPYMMVQPQQEHDNGHGHRQQQYPPPMYYPMPPPPEHDNIFSDKNSNNCSMM